MTWVELFRRNGCSVCKVARGGIYILFWHAIPYSWALDAGKEIDRKYLPRDALASPISI
jgi:hypothetical protein